MKIGIIGLPNVGKSSLFNLLTNARAQVAKFPFTTIDRNIGVVTIPDERLANIVKITQSPKVRCASIDLCDIAGLIKGAHTGEGLGNKFLSHIRDVDLIIHLLRCFADPDIPHTESSIVPQANYEVVRTELFLSDIEIVERRIEKIKKKAECREEFETLEKIRDSLNQERIPRETIPDLPLLSTKPEVIVLNLDEDGKFQNGIDGYRLSVKLEEDILEFTEDEKRDLRTQSNVTPGGLEGLLEICMQRLAIGLFYTIKGDEARAWLMRSGTKAIDAAALIHTDLKKGFIKAEVLRYEDFMKARGFTEAQHSGLTKIEGKEYCVQDGDILLIKFRD
jgi:GTP-binding protein YchF